MANTSNSVACFVLSCPNSSKKTPDKYFFNVPRDPVQRNAWFAAVGQSPKVSTLTVKKCCEDHFNMETDVSNWAQQNYLKQMGMKRSRLLLRPGVLPHIFRSHTGEPLPADGNDSETTDPDDALLKLLTPEIEIREVADVAEPSRECRMEGSYPLDLTTGIKRQKKSQSQLHSPEIGSCRGISILGV